MLAQAATIAILAELTRIGMISSVFKYVFYRQRKGITLLSSIRKRMHVDPTVLPDVMRRCIKQEVMRRCDEMLRRDVAASGYVYSR